MILELLILDMWQILVSRHISNAPPPSANLKKSDIHQWIGLHDYNRMKTQKLIFFSKKRLTLVFLLP